MFEMEIGWPKEMVRGRGKGENASDGREKKKKGALSLSLVFEKKNKNAGDHTRKPGDAHMSTNRVRIGSWINMATFEQMSNRAMMLFDICSRGGYNPQGSV